MNVGLAFMSVTKKQQLVIFLLIMKKNTLLGSAWWFHSFIAKNPEYWRNLPTVEPHS